MTRDTAPTDGADHAAMATPIVDWTRTARRLVTSLSIIAVAVALIWLGAAVVGEGPRLRLLAELVGLGLLAAFVVEVVVVGGSAVRGMLRAGERGERLARTDVSLLPPQVRRRGGDQ